MLKGRLYKIYTLLYSSLLLRGVVALLKGREGHKRIGWPWLIPLSAAPHEGGKTNSHRWPPFFFAKYEGQA
jgi:hypothetical protein